MSQIDELRQLIIGSDVDKLEQLKKRVEDIDQRTKDVAQVLAPAITKSVESDGQLVAVLEAPVAESLKSSIRKEPAEYGEILYPAMAPAIRQAISEAISSLFSTINQKIESATSVSGLRMRFEAKRTGMSYAELAFRKSLLYRVEHVYLIERESGLLIAELANSDGSEALDSDGVSAMFSAIQSFVQDSFSRNEEDRLTDFTVGEHRVWIVHGAKAMLACVIQGDAPSSLKSQLADVLDSIRIKYATQIASFDGDASGFVGIEDSLSPCLQLELKDPDLVANKTSLASIVLLGALLLGAVYGVYNWWDKRAKIDHVRYILQDASGFVVTNIQWRDKKMVIEGLMDPVVTPPYAKLKEHGVVESDIRWRMEPYQSLDSQVVLSRLHVKFHLPDSLKTEYDNGRLVLSGAAQWGWLTQMYSPLESYELVDEVDSKEVNVLADSLFDYIENEIGLPTNVSLKLDKRQLHVSGVATVTWLERLKKLLAEDNWVSNISYDSNVTVTQLKKDIEDAVIVFNKQDKQTQIEMLAKKIRDLTTLAKNNNQVVTIIVQGNSDASGSIEDNILVRQKRAETIIKQLQELGVNALFEINAEGQHKYLVQNERSVRFHLKIQ